MQAVKQNKLAMNWQKVFPIKVKNQTPLEAFEQRETKRILKEWTPMKSRFIGKMETAPWKS